MKLNRRESFGVFGYGLIAAKAMLLGWLIGRGRGEKIEAPKIVPREEGWRITCVIDSQGKTECRCDYAGFIDPMKQCLTPPICGPVFRKTSQHFEVRNCMMNPDMLPVPYYRARTVWTEV